MNTFKKLYKQFFGLTEQSLTKVDPTKDVVLSPTDAKDPKKVQAAQSILKTTKGRIHIEETELDEAQLINNLADYRGGVEFVLRDPAMAQQAVEEIQQWTAKKGITLVTKKISKNGKVVYMYFRLGQDPSAEAQKIQGYLAQMPDLKHFRFNVRQPKKKIQPEI